MPKQAPRTPNARHHPHPRHRGRCLTLAVTVPTIRCRQYADRLRDQSFSLAKSTVQKHLVAHELSPRSQRLSQAAAIAAATTEPRDRGRAEKTSPSDSACPPCPARARLRRLVLRSQAQTREQVYQLTAIDVFTRCAFVAIVLKPSQRVHTVRFVYQMLRHYRRHSQSPSDLERQRPEYVAVIFHAHLVAKRLRLRAYPSPFAQPQRRLRAFPLHHPSRVLETYLPSSSLHFSAPAPRGSRRLSSDLPPPPALTTTTT